MKERIDWSDPDNKVAQHNVRYLDRALHIVFADTEKVYVATGVGVNGALLPKELQNLRKYGLSHARRNFIETGGDKALIDSTITHGAQTDIIDHATGTIIRRKL